MTDTAEFPDAGTRPLVGREYACPDVNWALGQQSIEANNGFREEQRLR